MKVTVITPPGVQKVVPSLTLSVTFDTEVEMREYVKLVGTIPDRLNVIDPAFRAINEHLVQYSSKGV